MHSVYTACAKRQAHGVAVAPTSQASRIISVQPCRTNTNLLFAVLLVLVILAGWAGAPHLAYNTKKPPSARSKINLFFVCYRLLLTLEVVLRSPHQQNNRLKQYIKIDYSYVAGVSLPRALSGTSVVPAKLPDTQLVPVPCQDSPGLTEAPPALQSLCA